MHSKVGYISIIATWAVLLSIQVFSVAYADNSIVWNRIQLPTKVHTLVAFSPPELVETDTLTVFIEGDGRPGVALNLAKSLGGNIVYLSRPCQFPSGELVNTCTPDDWNISRFSEQNVADMNRAVELLKWRFKAKRLQLIGYSGGGAIAAILSAERDDVDYLVTVAGNMDIVAWSDAIGSPPLTNSLNPADFAEKLVNIRQLHLVGSKDEQMPETVLKAYLSKLSRLDNEQTILVKNADHDCCWEAALRASFN